MLILKSKAEAIVLETDGKVDVYVSWRDWVDPSKGDQVAPLPDSLLTVMGGGGEQTVLSQDTDYPRRQVLSFIASCRDQKDVRISVFLTDGNAKALLASGTLNPDSSLRYSPVDGFSVRQAV